MKQKEIKHNARAWNRYYVTFNPHFREYHAIREASGCSVFSSKTRANVIKWIAEKRQPVQLELFK